MMRNRPLVFIVLGLLLLTIVPMFFKSLYVSETGTIGQFGLGSTILIAIGLYKRWKWVSSLLIILMAVTLCFSVIVLFIQSEFHPGFLINIGVAIFVYFQTQQFRKVEGLES